MMTKKKEEKSCDLQIVEREIKKPERYVRIKTADLDVCVSSYNDKIETLNELALKNVGAVVVAKKKKEKYIG